MVESEDERDTLSIFPQLFFFIYFSSFSIYFSSFSIYFSNFSSDRQKGSEKEFPSTLIPWTKRLNQKMMSINFIQFPFFWLPNLDEDHD